LVVNTENGVQVTSGQSLTGTESTLSFDGKLQANSEPTSWLRGATAIITQSASSAYGAMQWRKSQMNNRTDGIMKTTLPSEQAQKIGEDWANFNEKIDFDAASPQAIIQKQAQRIHNNMKAAQAIRPLIAEIDNMEVKELPEGFEEEHDNKSKKLQEAKDLLQDLKDLQEIRTRQEVTKSTHQATNTKISENSAAIIKLEQEITSLDTDGKTTDTNKEAKLKELKAEQSTLIREEMTLDVERKDGDEKISTLLGKLGTQAGTDIRAQEEIVGSAQKEFDESTQQKQESEDSVEALKQKTEEAVTQLRRMIPLDDTRQVIDEARSDNQNAYKKLHKTTGENPKIKAYTTPKDTIQTAPQIAQTITNVAKAAQAANMQMSDVTKQAQKEFTTPESSSTARKSIDPTHKNQQSIQPTPPK